MKNSFFCQFPRFTQIPGTRFETEPEVAIYDGDRKVPPFPAERTCVSYCGDGYVPVVWSNTNGNVVMHQCLKPSLLQSFQQHADPKEEAFREMTKEEYEQYAPSSAKWIIPVVLGVGALALIGFVATSKPR